MDYIKQNINYLLKMIQPKINSNDKYFKKPDAYKNINSNRMLSVKQN